MKKISFLIFVAFFSVVAYGQLFTPLGLGVDKCSQNASLSTPQMHVEGDILYVCTSQGLYSKDLSNEESIWELVGFEGVPLQDYVRRGNDILALRNNNGNFLLLSHDDGKTYEDVTPDLFKEQHTGWTNVLTGLVQHPNDPNTLLVLSRPLGLYQSSDFGQTWNKLTDITSDHIGYHPLNPQIIYESGEDDGFSPETYISYDGGQTWEDYSPHYPGDNSVSRVAFHPTDPNRWIATGCGAVYISTENGHTWNTQDFRGDVQRYVFWRFIAYDNKNSDILYVVGWVKDKIEVMCSADGGMTWNAPQTEPIKMSPTENVNDFRQYSGKLLVYTESDVYEISKAELLAQTASPATVTINGVNFFLYLDSHEAVLTNGRNCSGELDIPSEVSYNDETFVVKSMTHTAFHNNSELTKVRIPKTIENILHSYPYDSDDEDPPTGMVSPDHMNPFRECTALEAIEVDEENPSFKSINGVLFSQDGVGHYYYLTNEYHGTGLYCYPAGRQQEAYSIPDGVEWIGANAFEGSRNLSTLTIPNSITHIYSCAFQNCNNLTDVYCYADNVPITWDYAFKDTPIASATLHVPAGSIEEYKTTSPWSGFGNIVALQEEPHQPLSFLEGMAWVDGFGYEQEGRYKVDDVKLFYYTTAGDTLINDKTYSRILKTRKCKTSYKLEVDAEGNEYVAAKELITQDDTLCFYMREDEAGNVWFYTEDKNVFYEISHNTLYDYLADNLVCRDLFLYNAKKRYALGDNLPLGMSVIVSPDGIVEGDEYWKICSSEVSKIDETTLLDGKTYMMYNKCFLENLGPLLGGPLSGIGEPNSYSLDFKQFFAFYKDGQLIYRNEGYLSALEVHFPNILDAVIGKSSDVINEPVTFTAGQIATIILPTEPDVSKGKYYRLDRVEEGKIIFEQEQQPRAHIPYIIVPSEDFSIDLSTLDLQGCYRDTVSVDDVSFIGSYVSEAFDYQEGFYIDIIDTTPDCRFDESCVIGALRAYLLVRWDDPYNQGGTKVPPLEKLEVVLHDNGTGINNININDNGYIYDLQGRKIAKPQKGFNIIRYSDGTTRKVLVK